MSYVAWRKDRYWEVTPIALEDIIKGSNSTCHFDKLRVHAYTDYNSIVRERCEEYLLKRIK